jgi:hypothetical protein
MVFSPMPSVFFYTQQKKFFEVSFSSVLLVKRKILGKDMLSSSGLLYYTLGFKLINSALSRFMYLDTKEKG